MDQARGLFLNGRDDARMVLPQRIDADAGDEIEIALAVDIPHVRAVAALENERMAGVILQQILLFEIDDGLSRDSASAPEATADINSMIQGQTA